MNPTDDKAGLGRAETLEVLARCDRGRLAALAEAILPAVESTAPVEVLQNRTGLVMLPMRDTVKLVDFHLGEVLVAEAHLRHGAAQGYGMRSGRDLEAAMGMAVVDLALALGIETDRIAAFLARENEALKAADTLRMRQVEATRVEMETF
ncbi:phosphonate C-P lyase system protein PhnG [uncultured Paracoccus sp.]|uniref:phosphonate C-P lyase system protein PhnG n=1 Tax=uncultured Paracoccus sp. TaxID=189685 RepID=UPI0025D74947|nr:phosphonate C-P lyase system protein PhnG [uncultured Paracoccus sp.]